MGQRKRPAKTLRGIQKMKTEKNGDAKTASFRVFGITGGVGSGKSEILNYLKRSYHACVLSCDEIARELQMPGGTCFEAITQLFGKEILTEDGMLDRQRIAQLIFGDEHLRKCLNEIVHPAVEREVLDRIRLARENGMDFAAVESAILIESGYSSMCDEIWYIYADREVRIARLAASRGYSREKSLSIMEAQSADEFFRKNAQYVIDNSGPDVQNTFVQTDRRLNSYGILQHSKREQW